MVHYYIVWHDTNKNPPARAIHSRRTPVPRRTHAAWLGLCALLPFESGATLGVFEHGAGIKSLGEGGISYVAAGETTAIAANPALALQLGSRYDVGIDELTPDARTSISGNSLGPDQTYDSDAHHFYPIPQGGLSWRLAPAWAAGATLYAGGLGPDYSGSPYARFASPATAEKSQSASLTLKISGLSLVLAHELLPGQSLGFAVNIQHEALNAKGLSTFGAFSESPNNVSDIGKHGAWGGSLSLGWDGAITPWLEAGLSWRSKSWSQKIHAYRGLLPDQGLLELPAIYGGALAFKPLPQLRVAVEFQRSDYGARNAFGNSIGLLSEGRLLGSADGPGFGWTNQNAYKLGVSWQALQPLRLRAGYVYNTAQLTPSQTFFNAMAPAVLKRHYTAGATWAFGRGYELSGYLGLAARSKIGGQGSIPPSLGGGEVTVSNELYMIGLSLGRQFGR
jgi:long-chain fatty acid transport protein